MNNTKPRVSIGLPVYNSQQYLEETLDSILAQTFTDFELVLSDNGSTDRTQAICEAYVAKDSRVKYYRNEQNRGAAWNYNNTYYKSQGEYFKWAAYDDKLAPTWLERCVEVLDNEPDAAIAYTRATLINEHGEVYGTYADDLDLREPKPHQRWSTFFARQGMCHPIFGLMRTKWLAQTDLTGNYPTADRICIGEMVLRGTIREIPDYLFLRRIHPLISTVANKNDAETATWFDPRNKGKIILPKWRRLREYTRSIFQAKLSPAETVLCLGVLARYGLVPNRWAGLLSDVSRAGKQVQARLTYRLRRPSQSAQG